MWFTNKDGKSLTIKKKNNTVKSIIKEWAEYSTI